jgi:hypothetical protein
MFGFFERNIHPLPESSPACGIASRRFLKFWGIDGRIDSGNHTAYPTATQPTQTLIVKEQHHASTAK